MALCAFATASAIEIGPAPEKEPAPRQGEPSPIPEKNAGAPGENASAPGGEVRPATPPAGKADVHGEADLARFERMVKGVEGRWTAAHTAIRWDPPKGKPAEDVRHELRKLSGNLRESVPAGELRSALSRMIELKCPEALRYIWDAFAGSWNAERRRMMLSAIADIAAGTEAAPAAAASLTAEAVTAFPRSLRMHAARCAARCDGKTVLYLLDAVISSPERYADFHRWGTVEALYAIGTEKAAGILIAALRDRDGEVAAAAAEALALLRSAAAIPAIIGRLKADGGTDRNLRADLAEALAELTGESFGGDAAMWEAWWEKARAGFAVPPPRAHAVSPTWKGPRQTEGSAPDDPYAWDLGDCPLDIVLLYDTTGSLLHKWPYLSTAVDSLLRELQRRAPRMRVGAVRYRATENSLSYRIMPFPMTRELDKVRASVREAMFGGGSGGLNLALSHALTRMRWRLKARRAVWIVGDMTPDAAGGGPSAAAFWIGNAAKEDDFLISTLYVESLHGAEHRATYRMLADLGGGRFYEYDEAERHWVDWTTGKADRKKAEFPHVLAEKLLSRRDPAGTGKAD
ncbi:MAG: HEAT repeat domain-containing protein [Planctomycetota bacterium]|nr:HEAT repeat domain-containing protein [Planctomycetota bacterium]